MLHIAIVDDEQTHRDILTKYIEEWRAREGLEAEVEAFTSSEAFYFAPQCSGPALLYFPKS